MSQDHPSSDDFVSRHDELSGPRLERIEQRLKHHRPRVPRIDLAAIALAARGPGLPAELPVERNVSTAGHRRTGRSPNIIAGSWFFGAVCGAVCGAAAGALLMFAILNPSRLGISATSPTASKQVAASAAERPARDRPAENPLVRRTDSEPESVWGRPLLRLPALLDPEHLSDYRLSHSGHRPKLRADSHLRRSYSMRLDEQDPVRDITEEGQRSEADGTVNPVARPDVTQEQMLRDLLSNDFGITL